MAEVFRRGAPLGSAEVAVVLLHGRGGTAESMLALADELPDLPVSWLAPAAPGNTWYPQSFLAPLEANQPWLDQALDTVDGLLREAAVAGVDRSRVVLLGFSQGALPGQRVRAAQPRPLRRAGAAHRRRDRPRGHRVGGAGDVRRHPGLRRHQRPRPHVPLQRVQDTVDVLGPPGRRGPA